MEVRVTVDLTVAAQDKHLDQMRSAARSLANDPGSVQVTSEQVSPRQIRARFTVPDARQEDVVDGIGRQFWQVEDYQNCVIGFAVREVRRTKGSSR